jgi:hypothetical protein
VHNKLSFYLQVVGGDANHGSIPVWRPCHRCSEDSKCIYANPLTPETGEPLRLLGLPFCLGFPVSGTEGVWTLAVKAHLSFFRTFVASPPTGTHAGYRQFVMHSEKPWCKSLLPLLVISCLGFSSSVFLCVSYFWRNRYYTIQHRKSEIQLKLFYVIIRRQKTGR